MDVPLLFFYYTEGKVEQAVCEITKAPPQDQEQWNVFFIPKKSGGQRIIEEPPPRLKEQQRKVITYLRSLGIGPGIHSTGFVKGKSIKDNALAHYGAKIIVSMDLKDAFHMVKEHHLRTCLAAEAVRQQDIDMVVETCLYKGRLSMGSPSSPDLLNIVCKHLIDPRIAGLANKYKATYTRYADNLEISSSLRNITSIIRPIRSIVEDVGFKLNEKKTHISRPGRRQCVTGLVVNLCEGEPRVRVNKARIRRFRAKLHNAMMAIAHNEPPMINIRKAEGFVAFVHMVSPELASKFRAELKTIKILRGVRHEPGPDEGQRHNRAV